MITPESDTSRAPSGELEAIRRDVEKLKQEHHGWLGALKNVALIVGLLGGTLSLMDGGFKVYDRLSPAKLVIERGGGNIELKLDPVQRRLALSTSVLLQNRGGDEDLTTNVSATVRPESADEDSTIYFTNPRLRRAESAETHPLPISVQAHGSESYTIELVADYEEEQKRILRSDSTLLLRLKFSTNDRSQPARELVACLHVGPLVVNQLQRVGKILIQPSSPCQGSAQ